VSVSVGTGARRAHAGSRGLHLFELGIVSLDLALVVFGIQSGALRGESMVDLGAWILLISAAGLIPVPSGRGVYLGLDLPLVLGAGFVFGPFTAGLLALLGVLDIRELRRQIPLGQAVFNRAQVSLSAMAGTWAFQATGGTLETVTAAVMPGLAAILADAVLNYSLVSAYWSIKSRRPLLNVVSDMRLGSPTSFAVAYFCYGFLSVLVGTAYSGWGIAGVLAFTAPVALARQAFHERHLLERADRRLRTRTKPFAMWRTRYLMSVVTSGWCLQGSSMMRCCRHCSRFI
jgi:hypothetical protein